MIKLSCGEKVTPEDYASLTQPERARLAELVKEKRKVDKLTPVEVLRARAFYEMLSEGVPFD